MFKALYCFFGIHPGTYWNVVSLLPYEPCRLGSVRLVAARDVWKKTYFDEKKKTLPLEDEAQRMQQELETLHKRFMSHLETDTKDTGKKKEQKNTQKVISFSQSIASFSKKKN